MSSIELTLGQLNGWHLVNPKETKTMAIELRRNADDTLVKPGSTLTTRQGLKIVVKDILGPSYRFGSSPIVDTTGIIRMPSEVGCYSTTV